MKVSYGFPIVKLSLCVVFSITQLLIITEAASTALSRSTREAVQAGHPYAHLLKDLELPPDFTLEDLDLLAKELEGVEDAPLLLPPHQPNNVFHVVDDCVKMSFEEGVYHFKSRGGMKVCGIFFVADPDKVVNIHVEYLDVRCKDKGLISVVDGWELNGEVFPSSLDHEKEMSQRFHDLCVDDHERKLRRTFTSSQNAALIQYRVPSYGQGFSVRVQHVYNPRPCNILVQDLEGIYKLENFGAQRNCSLTTLFNAKLKVLFMSTGTMIGGGGRTGEHHVKFPSRTPSELYHKCGKLGLKDYVQIGGSSGLDTSRMEVIEEFCGHQAQPMGTTTVFCGMTTLRLLSSGKYQNKIVVEVRRAELEDAESANFICDM